MSAQELGGNGSEAQQFTNTINGSSRGSKAIHQGIDPSTKKPLWEVPIASQKDLDEAVMVAQKAFVSWSQKTWQSRQEILASMSKILAEHHEEMAEILSKECGKPVSPRTSDWRIQ
jgi:acyl-CoA reductase-like NAD-dependent aldehyde dehydrogenase